MRLIRRILAERRLTRATEYLMRRHYELAWRDYIHGKENAAEIAALESAIDILWRLSWMT